MLEKSQEIVAEMSESVFFSPWKKSFEVLMMQRLGLYFTALHEKGWLTRSKLISKSLLILLQLY